MSAAPAGWYPDAVPGVLRWYDGAAWTDHTAPDPDASPGPDATAAHASVPHQASVAHQASGTQLASAQQQSSGPQQVAVPHQASTPEQAAAAPVAWLPGPEPEPLVTAGAAGAYGSFAASLPARTQWSAVARTAPAVPFQRTVGGFGAAPAPVGNPFAASAGWPAAPGHPSFGGAPGYAAAPYAAAQPPGGWAPAVGWDGGADDRGPRHVVHWMVPVGRSWQSIAAGYVGLLTLGLWVLAPVAIGLGIWALVKARTGGHGRGRAIFAIVVGVLGIGLTALVLPTVLASVPA